MTTTCISIYKDDNTKVLQPIMKSEGMQSAQGCAWCKDVPRRLLRLPCGHGFCVKCLTLTYHKHSSSMPRDTLTRCLVCQRTCELPQSDVNAIMEFTDKVVIPLAREELERQGQGQSQFQLSNNELSTGKQFKSHEMSTEKVTPAGKGFYSRCESPKTGFGQAFCQVHPQQELNIVCFSCNNSVLCIPCVKKHTNHNMKTIAKGLDTIQEQIALSRLKGKEHLDRLEIAKRRLEERRSYLQEKWEKTLNSLKVHFNNLVQLATRKCEEVLESYSSFYEQSMEEAVREGARVDEALRHAKRQLERLSEVSQAQGNPIQLIRKSTQVMEALRELRDPDLTEELGQCDSERVVRDVVHICERLEKVEAQCNRQTLKTHAGQNWKSEEKLKDFKRVKTNVMSLNSSRDRKEKKCTKTEEDQKRNKSRANYKTESSSKLLKVNKACPTYLLQHIDKQSPDFLDLNNLQSSFKSTSKVLSKSHLPSAADEHRRKKEHQTYIKDCLQRKERKTFNATSKEGRSNNEVMRKKKILA